MSLPNRSEEIASSPHQAKTLREEGNQLYKAGKVNDARIKYVEAVKLSPDDDAPLRNLSAALYELGDYEESARTATKAIELLENDEEHGNQNIEKLQQRLQKIALHTNSMSNDEQCQHRLMLQRKIPRYRPSMFVTTEYFTVGHDIATSLFGHDRMFEKWSPGATNVSFFLGGVGDARNFFQTISVLAELEKNRKVPQRQYHFTLNDNQKAALARDIVICMLIGDLTELEEGSEEALMLLNTIFFVYVSTMMPSYAFRQLSETIDRAIDALKGRRQPLTWLYLHEADFEKYIAALSHWKEKAPTVFTNRDIMLRVEVAMAKNYENPHTSLFRKEERLYYTTAMLVPSRKVLEHHDSELLNLVDAYISKKQGKTDALRKHIAEHWQWNTTLMDEEWYGDMEQLNQFDVGFDPFQTFNHFPYDEVSTKPKSTGRLFDHVAPFFTDAAKAIRHLGDRFQAEVILGDYAEVAEKLQFGLYKVESGGIMSRPEHFPAVYDRIHLSNVPDYMGGHLSTFLYAMPILRQAPGAVLKATCLKNADSFDKVEDYLSEYQLIPDDATLQALFQVGVLIRENPDYAYPMADYTVYMWQPPNSRHDLTPLLTRKAFNKWFYGLFFRLTLPFYQNMFDKLRIIFSPLNLTILFRLVTHLNRLGYPAHWLSEVLTNIIENKVISTTRPPRTKPAKPADVTREYPSRHLCTTPFATEMATLYKIFVPLLPFQLSSSRIPELDQIYKYKFRFPTYINSIPQPSNLMLLFYDKSCFGAGALDPYLKPYLEVIESAFTTDSRCLLDPSSDEVNEMLKGPVFEELRERGLISWSTFDFDTKEKVASAWMPETLITGMQQEDHDWMVGLVRTDTWAAAFQSPTYVKDVEKGEKWAG